MNKELKNKWISALRSGNYEQASGALVEFHADGTAYCCLGVLLCVSGSYRNAAEFHHKGSLTHAQRSDLLAPQHHELETWLISMNDGRGASFSEIADYIEQNVAAE
jgi:hypothetical protein